MFDLCDDLEMFSLIISSAAHDVGHPGLTNRFLVNKRDEIALTYNDRSVLEMMHCSIVFSIINK